MRNSTFWAGCLLGAALGLVASSEAQAQQVQWQYGGVYPRYTPPLVDVYGHGYAYAYGPRRTYRQVVRLGYLPTVPVLPRGPSDFLGSPYRPYSVPSLYRLEPRTPTVYRLEPRTPNIYQPEPFAPTVPLSAGVPSVAPTLTAPAPEPIPAPPSEPGPREF